MLLRKIICLLLTVSITLLFTGCKSSNSKNSDESKEVDKNLIQFDTNGGTGIAPKLLNTLYSAPMTTKEDSLFVGWYLDETLTIPVVFPLEVDSDMTIYAKWLKISYELKCSDFEIKWGTGYKSSVIFDVTPNGFDLQELSKMGYNIKITVKYDVAYIKDYDVWLDIGYAGSPRYEVSLLNSQRVGRIKENLSTKGTPLTRTIELTRNATSLINDRITLEFSTNNVQNIICFGNIVVTYYCYE